MDEREAVLQRAREPRSAESIEAERRWKLDRAKQIEAMKQLTKTPEWEVYKDLVIAEEQEKWERQALDPSELQSGVVMTEVVSGADEHGMPVKQQMPSPVEGMTWIMKRVFAMGVAWGVRNGITYPERAEAGYTRMMEAQARQQQLERLAGNRAPISGIHTNPIEGGS